MFWTNPLALEYLFAPILLRNWHLNSIFVQHFSFKNYQTKADHENANSHRQAVKTREKADHKNGNQPGQTVRQQETSLQTYQ